MHMCPRCKIELHKKHLKGVSVEECSSCKGTFFDKGELEKARDNADENLRWLDFVPFDVKSQFDLEHDRLDCPSCGTVMNGYQYKGSKVVISKCPHCHGVWLDKGEFEKMLSYLEAFVASQTSSDLADDARKQLAEVFAPHKSESEEIKDLIAVTNLLEERWVAEHPTIEKIIEVYYELTPFK